MEHLLTHITGVDMALCLLLLTVYIWRIPGCDDRAEGLDSEAID
ncbi:MAG: hypothetical protein ACOX9R_20265 [Armatimonadota bacterium]|jgi:hypothetical protein